MIASTKKKGSFREKWMDDSSIPEIGLIFSIMQGLSSDHVIDSGTKYELRIYMNSFNLVFGSDVLIINILGFNVYSSYKEIPWRNKYNLETVAYEACWNRTFDINNTNARLLLVKPFPNGAIIWNTNEKTILKLRNWIDSIGMSVEQRC